MKHFAALLSGLVWGILLDAQVWRDPDFGTDGLVATSLSTGYDGAFHVLLQPDGKIVVVGSIAGPEGGYDFLVARYRDDGSVDTDFGTDGVATHDVGTQDIARAAALQADGRIVVVGTAVSIGSDKVVLRLRADGEPDDTFDEDGELIIDDGMAGGQLNGVAVQPDQRIVIVGQGFDGSKNTFYIARLEADGSFDMDFGTDGQVEHLIGTGNCRANAVAITDGGYIVSVGSSYTDAVTGNDVAVVRYRNDGTLDPDFGDAGKVVIPWTTASDHGYAIGVQADGRIVVGGVGSESLAPVQVMASRLLADGTLDASFGTEGVARSYAGTAPTRCGGLAIDAEGRILLAGTATATGSSRQSYLARLSAEGVLDPAFGTDGELFNGGPDVYEETPGIAVQPDGKMILAGITGAGPAINVRLIRYLSSPITGITELGLEALAVRHADARGIDLATPFSGAFPYTVIGAAGRVVAQGTVRVQAGVPARIAFATELPAGAYLLNMQESGARRTARFVVVR